jgi:hypothetical protein
MLELAVEACDTTLVDLAMVFFLGEAAFKSRTDTLALIASSTTDDELLAILAEPPLSLLTFPPLTRLLLLTIAIGCSVAYCFLMSFLSFSICSVVASNVSSDAPLCVFDDTTSFLRMRPPFLTVVLLMALASSASMSLTTELNYCPVAAEGEKVPLPKSVLNMPSRISGMPLLVRVLGTFTDLPRPGKLDSVRLGRLSIMLFKRILCLE